MKRTLLWRCCAVSVAQLAPAESRNDRREIVVPMSPSFYDLIQAEGLIDSLLCDAVFMQQLRELTFTILHDSGQQLHMFRVDTPSGS